MVSALTRLIVKPSSVFLPCNPGSDVVAVTGAILVALLDLGAWRVVSRMFDSERMLTRYGRT